MAAYRILGNPFFIERLLKKRRRIHPARGSGGVPQLLKSPKTGGYRGFIKTTSAVSDHWEG